MLHAVVQAGSLQSTRPLQLSSRPLLQISGSFAREALSKRVVVKATLLRRLGSVVLVPTAAMLSSVSSQLNAPNGGGVRGTPRESFPPRSRSPNDQVTVVGANGGGGASVPPALVPSTARTGGQKATAEKP